jgi:hypothetical protein
MASSAGTALSLIRAVLDLNRDRRTGVLDVTADGVRTRIYFEDGKPVFAENGAPAESAEHVCTIITQSLQREESQWSFLPSPAAAKPPRSFSLEINPGAGRPHELVVVAAGARVPDGMLAEQAFQKGVALLRAEQTAPAAIELRRASQLRPESLQYLLYAIWAETRSHRDIPSEPDQQRLREVAQQAKTSDPAFAFAAYVIGQISMWAGDDATAKKWFYEALRLDPASEAGAQVRILARRGTGPSGLSGVWKLPDAAPPAEPAPVPMSEPPVQATKSVQQPSGASPRRWAERLMIVAVLVATGGFVTVVVARTSKPGLAIPPSPLSQPAPSVGVALPVAVQPQVPSPPPESPGGENGAEGGDKGTVLLPSRASGHRIFVDGRRAETDGKAPLHLPCGAHVIQIGSRGTPEHIDLPCRGEIQLE